MLGVTEIREYSPLPRDTYTRLLNVTKHTALTRGREDVGNGESIRFHDKADWSFGQLSMVVHITSTDTQTPCHHGLINCDGTMVTWEDGGAYLDRLNPNYIHLFFDGVVPAPVAWALLKRQHSKGQALWFCQQQTMLRGWDWYRYGLCEGLLAKIN